MRITVLAALIGCTHIQAATAQSFICSVEASAGVYFNSERKEWDSAHFKTGTQFTITPSKHEKAKFEVKKLGDRIPFAWCVHEFSDDGSLGCKGLFQDIDFNKGSLRFLKTYTAGYWNESALSKVVPARKKGNDAPSIAISTCAEIN